MVSKVFFTFLVVFAFGYFGGGMPFPKWTRIHKVSRVFLPVGFFGSVVFALLWIWGS